MLRIFNQIRMLLLAAWLGAAIFFSAVVAPTVFRVLRAFDLPNANEIAGTIVTGTLSVVNTSGFIVGLLVLVTAFALKEGYRRRAMVVQLVLSLTVAVAAGLGEWVIAANMRGLRKAMHLPIDQIPLSDPYRIAFAALHGYSVAALGIAIIAGLITFFVIAAPAKSN